MHLPLAKEFVMQQTAVNFASHDPSSRAGSTVGLALISLFSVHAGLDVLVAGILIMSLVMAPEAVSRALAKLCSALTAARSPAVPSAPDLIHVAQESFVGALQRGIGVGAAVATSAAVLTVHFLRKAREDACPSIAHGERSMERATSGSQDRT